MFPNVSLCTLFETILMLLCIGEYYSVTSYLGNI